MPKPPSFPDTFDELRQLKISSLRRWGYLKEEHEKHGSITWTSSNGSESSISITVNSINSPFITLYYTRGGESINYHVQFELQPSNLGKGYVWYFVCPVTNKRCTKLHYCDGYFLHRSAFKGVFYEGQIYSRNTRVLLQHFKRANLYEEAYDKLRKPYFKKYYGGRITKKYQKVLDQIKMSDSYSYEEIKGMYHGVCP